MNELQTECKRCGMCCTKGGPALHSQDLELVHGGQLPIEKLITIRKGELAHNPLTGAVQPVKSELVKIKGTGKDWRCTYFNNAARGCTIYGSRPLSCRTLKCWAPDELLKIVEKDTLSRMDILTDDDHFAGLSWSMCLFIPALTWKNLPMLWQESLVKGKLNYSCLSTRTFNIGHG